MKLCKNTDEETSVKSYISKIIMSNVGERDYSAQEVAHVLMGWPMYVSSREFVTLYITDEVQLEKIHVINN